MAERPKRTGYTTTELIVVLAILGIICGIAIPSIQRMCARASLAFFALNVIDAMREQKDDANLVDRNRAMKFYPEGDHWTWRVYEDADLDGVRNDDIQDGIDKPVRYATKPLYAETGARISMPDFDFPDPDDDGALVSRHESPVNFNRSTLCSFSPAGNSTPGSVYISAWGEVAVIRCSGSGGTIRLLFYDRYSRKWVPHW
jgi:Tfp pilus assembly protein FimT